MNGYTFTNGLRAALAQARAEASKLGHDHVAPTHILLGLLAVADNDIVAVLKRFQIAPSAIERELMRRVPRGDHVGDDVVATGAEWLSELGTMTRQLADSVDLSALQREIRESAAGRGVRELLTAAKGEQKFLED